MKTSILTALAVFLFSGFIGYSTNYTNEAKASENKVIFVKSPPTIKDFGLDLDINMNKGTAVVRKAEKDVKIKIERKDSIIYRTKYKKVFVNRPVPVPVRITPSFAKVRKTPVVLASMANSD